MYPVYALLFQQKGLSLPQISMLFAIWSIPGIILEIPTGILADMWNRKKMLIIASITYATCYIFWYFADGFWLFALGFIVSGIAGTFESGSLEALLFDSLTINKEEKTFDQVYGRGKFLGSLGIALAMISGGFMAQHLGMSFVIILSGVSSVIVILITLKFKETNLYKSKRKKSGLKLRNYFSTFKDSIKFCVNNKEILLASLILILVISTAGTLDEYDPLIAKEYGLGTGLVGVWVFIRYLFDAAGSGLAHKINVVLKRFGIKDNFKILWLISFTGSVALLVYGLINNSSLLPAYILFYFLMSAGGILYEDYIQQAIVDEGRATVHSMIELVNNLYGLVFYLIFAGVIQKVGIMGISLLFALFALIPVLIIGTIYINLNKSRKVL